MSEKDSTRSGLLVVVAAFLAYFVFFGYRSAFSVLLTPMTTDMGWDAAQVTSGYSIMMLLYAVTSYFSGMIFPFSPIRENRLSRRSQSSMMAPVSRSTAPWLFTAPRLRSCSSLCL